MYSISCKSLKYNPSKIVKKSLFFLSFKFMLSIAWWDQVTVNPDEIKMIVFIKGMSNGLNGLIPIGGQYWPISMLGARDEWK